MSTLESLGAGASRMLHGLGLTLLGLGVVAIVAPFIFGATLVVLVGLVLLAGGGILILVGLRTRAAGQGNAGVVAGGIVAVSGLVLVVQPSLGLATVRWILVACFLVGGAFQVSSAMQLGDEEGRGWVLLDGAWSVVLGLVMALGWPISGARAIGLLVGAKLAASGLTLIRLHDRLVSVGERVASIRERRE